MPGPGHVGGVALLRKAEHIGINVKDIERSIRFYGEVLGLALIERREFRHLKLAFFKIGDTELELIEGARGYEEADGVVNHLAFSVDNVDEVLDHLRRHGVELIDAEPREIWDGCRIAFFRGPDGEKLELFQRPGGSR